MLPFKQDSFPYRGSNVAKSLKFNQDRQDSHRIAEKVNEIVANNPNSRQQILYIDIARELNVDLELVLKTLKGGHNGINLLVTDDDRLLLAQYKK